MSLLVGLQHREQLDDVLVQNLDELTGALSTAFVALARGEDMPLLLGLQTPEQLDPIVRDELDQILAAIQTAFNSEAYNLFVKSYIEYEIRLNAGEATQTKTIPAVATANTELVYLGINTAETASY